MHNECERCERLQVEADRVRDMLRSTGVEGFGALSEGVGLLCQRIAALLRHPLRLECALSDDEVACIDARVRATHARLRADDSFRERLPVRLEVLRLMIAMLADAQHLECKDMLEAVNEIEKHLIDWLRKHTERQHHE